MRLNPKRVARWIAYRMRLRVNMAGGAAFDRKYGIETIKIVKERDLKSTSPNLKYAFRYHPTVVGGLKYSLELLDIDPRDFIFVDIGSGKGRVLVEAAEYPFKKIVGVEFCRDLHITAQHTVSQFRNKTGNDRIIELLCMDAVEYTVPEQNVIFYLYHPFSEPVMETVTKNIESMLARSGNTHDVIVIYATPVLHGAAQERVKFQFSSHFLQVANGRTARLDYSVYRSKPVDISEEQQVSQWAITKKANRNRARWPEHSEGRKTARG